MLFWGEGGDSITVDMAKLKEPIDDPAAIDHAKALLVQTAVFQTAANEYDALSNGNFDEVAATAMRNVDGSATYVLEYRDAQVWIRPRRR